MQVSGIAILVLESDGKAVLEVAGRPTFVLNPVAVTIWENLAAGHPVQEIVSKVATRFNVPEERAASDVERFVELLRHQFLVVNEPQSATS
jgi:hypothetical protein